MTLIQVRVMDFGGDLFLYFEICFDMIQAEIDESFV